MVEIEESESLVSTNTLSFIYLKGLRLGSKVGIIGSGSQHLATVSVIGLKSVGHKIHMIKDSIRCTPYTQTTRAAHTINDIMLMQLVKYTWVCVRFV